MEEGIQLIEALRDGKRSEAIKILTTGVDVCMTDENGRQAMHYAAAEGYTDVIVMMMDYSSRVNIIDNNCDTPLHMAARGGHAQTIMVLLSLGAYIHARDLEGYTALEIAIRGSHLKAVETLLTFGADPGTTSIDWSYKDTAEIKMTSRQRKIFNLLHSYRPLSPALRSGGIVNEANVVLPGYIQHYHACKMNVWVKDDINPFLLLLTRTQTEYTDMSRILMDHQRSFSDKYECRAFKTSEVAMQSIKVHFSLTIDGAPSTNESIVLITLQSRAAIKSFKVDREKNETSVEVSMICTRGNNEFAIAVEENEKQKVEIAKEAVTVRPKMAPEAAINIPEDTFDNPTEVIFNILSCDTSDDIVMTNQPPISTTLLCISTQDSQQPKKDVQVSLPVTPEDASEGMCVLGTSKESPESAEDWEVIDAAMGNDGKTITFNIKHFSIYAPAHKKAVEKDFLKVTEALEMTVRGSVKAECSVYIRHIHHKPGLFEMVIELTAPRKTKTRKQFWMDNGFLELEYGKEAFRINKLQTFKFSFKGNMRKRYENDFSELNYDGKRKVKAIMFEMEVIDMSSPIEGTIVIEKEVEFVKTVNKVEPVPGLFCSKTRIVKAEVRENYMDFLKEIPLQTEIPVEEDSVVPMVQEDSGDQSVNEQLQQMITETEIKYPSTIAGYNAHTLGQIAKQLSMVEVKSLSINLLVSKDEVRKMRKESKAAEIVAFRVLIRYRGKRPYISQIDTIANALKSIGRDDLAKLLPETKGS